MIENNEIKDFNQDGYVDVSKKIGTNPKKNRFFDYGEIPTDEKLAQIYTFDGLSKRYIDLLSDDMTRNWIEIKQDSDGKILNYLQNIKAKNAFKEALRVSKLFGGAIIFMVIDDGKEPNKPVDLNSIKSIRKLKIFPRQKINISDLNYYKDPTKPTFGEPEFFELNSNGSIPITVHETRCLIFKGDYYPSDEITTFSQNHKFWGLPILIPVQKAFESYEISIQSILESLTKFNVDVVKIKNLMNLLRTKDGERNLNNRIQFMDLVKSINNTIVLDSDEQYETVSQQFSNIADVISKAEFSITAKTGIPSNIFFGTSSKGLNATGDNEVRIYYDKIKSRQEEDFLDPLNRLILYVNYSKDYDGLRIKNPSIVFNSLWQLTDKEIVELRNKQSETDIKYIESGVLDPSEVRKSRFGNKIYSVETILESEDIDSDEIELEDPEDDESDI